MASYLPMIFQAAGAGTGVSSSISGFYANRRNERSAQIEGAQAAALAETQAGQLARRNRALTAAQVAGYGASGVGLEGTPTDVLTADAVQGELDALLATYQGQAIKKAKDYEARQFKSAARQNIIAGTLQGIFDPAGVFIKNQGLPAAKITPPTIRPGGSTSGASPGMSTEQWKAGYNAPELDPKQIFG